jgi:hypothetical protein
MLDFSPVRRKAMTMAELVHGLTPADLRRLTDEMVDTLLGLIAAAADDDVVFVPQDPEAYDAAADNADDVGLAWTLGHVIVHTTASAEEAAFIAAELARGVPLPAKHRSRSEVPWQGVTTIAQCRARLEESRRMRLATLAAWPDAPRLDNVYPLWDDGPRPNAVERFVRGLAHDDSHLGQIRDIVAQARAAREHLPAR